MKPDLYIRSLLTIAVVLLSVIAARLFTLSTYPVVHAAGPVVYQYDWFQYGFDVPQPSEGMEKIVATLGTYSQKGWELVAIVPVASSRNDNIATGTRGLLAILRKPK